MGTIASGESLVNEEIERYIQWMLGATKPRGLIQPKASISEHPERSYNLKNSACRKYLQHEEQEFGVNLGWTNDGSNTTGDKVARWFFTRKGSDDNPIRFGETIALALGGNPSFLHYDKRAFGINLEWSTKPVFEWKLLGGKIGEPVHTQEWIAIFNEKVGECLIYFDRPVGGNIGWPSSETWTEAVTRIGKGLASDLWDEAKKRAVEVLLSGGKS